ncbi:protein FAM91A1 [Vigna radiata var. radiata]|uniref:Protein FAM91A1 n=1 Tax=Vigna radiata var. radiata TaxID=3916 RepID=A0A1S3UA99_VIGRR|nr:protein FAM91A1 [Vigna radiata var. radiata]
MQRATQTAEERWLEKAVKEECTWENLPRRLHPVVSSKEEWHKRIIEYCIKKRLKWEICFARKVCKENEYYEDMMRYLQRNLALFPYHLADYVCRVMRVTPFRYYIDMIFEVMKNEQPYDRIPNFSAADALRLTGIGRNEFIDIMNKCRSKKIMWKLNKSIAKDLLPTQPVDFPVEPWWAVCLVNLTLEEFKKLSKEEMEAIDKVCLDDANSFVTFDPHVIRGLCRRGLVYFDVPVYPHDRFKVLKLEGFVSNREQTYEDPIEELLYAVFVVSNENVTVSELATTLQADLSQLQAASAFVCRLGWATKVIDPESIIGDSTILASPMSTVSDEDGSVASQNHDNTLFENDSIQQADTPASGSHASRSSYTRVAFIVDANITSYLMMGSVSPGLKSHAVTLYEAGKLGHASIADLCKDLSTLEGARYEGELQEFANHLFSLRHVLECLQSGGIATDEEEEGSDNLNMITSSNDGPSSVIAEISLDEKSEESGVLETVMSNEDLINSVSGKFVEALVNSKGVPSTSTDKSHTSFRENEKLPMFEADKSHINFHENEKPAVFEGSDVKIEMLKRKKIYRVDLLRSESLASLSPTTLDRLFLRDYGILVSLVPLPPSSILPKPTGGPVHFGPPAYSSMSPWMKLVLYSTAGSGPLSVVLMKGQCMRLLPAPLTGCEKALIWSWDGSAIGDLGRKLEGNMVKGSILLHCLNSLLKQSAVLVLPLSRFDLNQSGKLVTLDVPLPLRNADGSIASVGKELGLEDEEENFKLNSLLNNLANKMELWTVGYVRLLKLFNGTKSDQFSSIEKYEWVPLSVEFGIPLFSPTLCNSICRRIVSSKILQSGSFGEHHDAMQILRTKLRDICDEYNSTGPAAKLLYKKEEDTEQPMDQARATWNPLIDISPSSGVVLSVRQRLKLANKQSRQNEVMCCDGSVLRSYALTLPHEAATSPVKETPEDNKTEHEPEPEANDSKEATLPGVNLIFDGSRLLPFDVGACLQARQPISLVMEAATASKHVPYK